MTLRASEIGADTFSRNDRELDKNNLSTKPNETEHRHEYPELSPGRALLNVETGELYELMHRVGGYSEAMEGNQTSFEERLDWKYGTPKGQDWGGIVQYYFISVAVRQSPTPNHHGEIQVPINRPTEHEITDLEPTSFHSQILSDSDGEPQPLVLLERPEVTYEEVIPGETYDIIGWYWPNADTPEERVKPVEELPHRFPHIADVGSSTSTTVRSTVLDLEIPWDDVDTDTDAIRFEPTDGDDAFTVSVDSPDTDFHISHTGSQLVIDNPYDANELVKSISAWVNWNDNYEAYTVDGSTEVLAEMVRTYTADGHALTVSADAIETYASVETDVEPDEYVELSTEDILTYAFTEEVTVGATIDIPGIDLVIDTTDIDSDIVAFETNDNGDIVVSGVDEPTDNHVRGLVDGQLGIDAAKEHKELVKAIDWNQYRYGWDNSYGAWTVNVDGLGAIIESYTEAGVTLTASLPVLSAVGDEETITETQQMDIDEDAASGLDSYTPGVFQDVFDYTELEVDVSSDESEAYIHDLAVTGDADAFTLMALDLTIADTGDQDGMNVAMNMEIENVPDTVRSSWQPAESDNEDVYAWWNPDTGARVEVHPTTGWGTEYELHVQDDANSDVEHIVTLADERMVVQQAILHMKAINTR